MTVRQITAEGTRALRHEVLWPHIENLEDCIIDIDERKDAIHLGAFHKGRLVSVCSLFEMNTPKLEFENQYRLRAMATHPDCRGLNAGKSIIEYALKLLADKSYDVLWCDAREVALGFYGKLGFDFIDEWYEVPNVGAHKLMYKRL